MILRINKPADKDAMMAYIKKLPEGKQFIVNIDKKKEVRTLPQNKLYWLWLNCISQETGNEVKDLHEHFTEYYLPRETVQIFDKTTERPISTTKLSTIEFTAYLEKIEQFSGSELGIVLPHPEDLYFAEAYEKYSHTI